MISRNPKPSGTFIGLCLAISLASSVVAAEPIDPAALQFFENRIRPVLAENCYKCHGENKQKGGLRLDNLGYMLEGGSNGPVLVPGDAVASHIYKSVSYEDPEYEMPPDGKLPDHQIADIKRWIEMGAPWPAAEVIEARKPGEFTDEERAWWSFQPLKDVTPPTVASGKAIIRNDVDRFILAKLQEAGLEQAPAANPLDLLRRVYFNLHGLPPSEDEILEYLNDKRPDAYERLIEKLLASPRYGMRWGQHWLDLVRYAESDGYREDAYRPDAWSFRDYVIRSFNEDKPYNQFVREQLAGDEINPNDPNVLIGAGFLRHGIYEWNQADAEMQRDIIVSELAGLTSEVFLGLSVGCAQCHDHKFDPILQRDYYRMKSFFEPLQWRDDVPLATPAEIAAHAKTIAAWEAESAEARAAWDAEKQAAVKAGTRTSYNYYPPAVQEMMAKPEAERTAYEKQVAYLVARRTEVEIGRAIEKFKPKSTTWAAYKAMEDRKPKPLPKAFIATDVGSESPPTLLKTRRDESLVKPGFLTILAPDEPEIKPLTEIQSTGRRTALANWIADPANPLSTRVIVNRVWQYHFGRGLSGIASDFGKLGEAPSHPELLDWLTKGFIANNWSFKWLHRQILLSATYQQSTLVKASARANEVDPENRLLWRARPQRLDAEQLRDTLLMISGDLKPKSGGPSEESSQPAPSIFTRKMRNSPDEVLSRFDAPPGFQSVAQRDATNTALQSLLMVNGEWPMQRALSMAGRILKKHPEATDTEHAASAFSLVFGRPANHEELEGSASFLKKQRQRIEESREKQLPVPPLASSQPWFPENINAREPALTFHPGTEHERIRVRPSAQENLDFTIEAVIYLDSIYQDASVRTIASRWNSDQATKGWALGVTGGKSRIGPGELIMQLNGDDFQAALTLEVVASGLKIAPRKPYYIAATLSSETLPGKSFGGHIRFFVLDLSDPAGTMLESKIPHLLGDGYVNPTRALVIGGRDGPSRHLWSGGIQRLAISNGAISKEKILPLRHAPAPGTLVELRGNDVTDSLNGPFTWIKTPKPADPGSGSDPVKLEALADLFHALINSNEFLYQP